jgi:hypothetical protein
MQLLKLADDGALVTSLGFSASVMDGLGSQVHH